MKGQLFTSSGYQYHSTSILRTFSCIDHIWSTNTNGREEELDGSSPHWIVHYSTEDI